MSLKLNYAVVSDRGLVRGNNEDSAYAGPNLLVIADGMGGHAAGEVASQLMVTHLERLDADPADNDMLALLGGVADDANREIAEAIRENPETDGMGTTLTALMFNGRSFGLIHVGDSRGYRLRDGRLEQITVDDTFVQSLVNEGKLDPGDVSSHPQKSLILKAYTGRPVEPTLRDLDARPGDRILLCTDGLSDPVTATTIEQALSEGAPADAARRLIELALRSGGPDNITVVIADVVETDELDDAARAALPTVAVTAGAILGPAQIGLLAAVGRSKVLVYPRPRLSVISVGRELVDTDREPGLGQIYDVNSYALAAAGKEAGADVHRVGIAVGEPRRLKEIVETQIQRSEVIVISGAVGGEGSSLFRSVLEELGDIDTSRVAMHPGSVQGFGLLGAERIPVFLLPSNPVSALVTFEVLVRPLIRTSLGKRNIARRVVRARALNHIASREGRRGYIRARLMRDAETSDYLVEGIGAATGAPAHLLAGLAEANALIRVPEEATEIRPGDIVDVMFLAQGS